MDKLSVLRKASEFFRDSLKKCDICPRGCMVDRSAGRRGYCRSPYNPVVYSYLAHRGEEPPISGKEGSGTIFFSGCNMKCVYCQNYSFSQMDQGNEVSIEKLAEIAQKERIPIPLESLIYLIEQSDRVPRECLKNLECLCGCKEPLTIDVVRKRISTNVGAKYAV